jgi:glycosyltransferase involved in cell wall biosynthesis
MIKVLMISTDAKILEEGSLVRARMIEYGTLFSELHIVVFATGKYSSTMQIAPNVFAYPTNSFSKILCIKDAVSIGVKIIKEKGFTVDTGVITTQDPFETGVVGRLLSKASKIHLHVQIHTDFQSPYFKKSALNKIRRALSKRVLPSAQAIRVVSERIFKSLPSDIKGKTSILPIFADGDSIQNTSVVADIKKKYSHFKKVVLIASRITKEKDISTALKAFKESLISHPGTGLVIVGSGPEEGALKKEARLLGLEKSAVFESWADHNTLISYMKSCDVFLSSSLYEGYGLSMLEAHTAGAVLVATDTGIAPELVANDFLVEVGNSKHMAEALNKALSGNVLPKHYEYSYSSKEDYLKQYQIDVERTIN